jgi:hypothetical protein
MATVLEECTIKEQRSVVRFLWAKGPNAKAIHREMGSDCRVKRFKPGPHKFSQGHSKVADDARPCRPVEIATEATVQRVEELIRADRRITIDSVATALGCTASSHTARATQDTIQELEYSHKSPDLAPSDFHLFDTLKSSLVANVSLMTKRLKRRCGSG